jgi:hypothetical protein
MFCILDCKGYMWLSILMASVMCLHFSMREEDGLERTNVKCHLCTLWSTCRPLCNKGKLLLEPFYTRDWERMIITPRALSLVEKAELVQIHFTLRLRDQHIMWMQDGCKVYMDWMDYVSWSLGLFSKPPVGGRPNRKPGDHGIPNTRNRWSLFYFIICEDPHK